MEIGSFLLLSTIPLTLLDLVFLRKKKIYQKGKLNLSSFFIYIVFCFIAVSFLSLAFAFASNDFSVIEVYNYSSSDLPLTNRLFAAWGGARGSMLFLTFMIGLVYFAYRLKTNKSSTEFSVSASRVLGFMLIVFLIVTIFRNPFERFEAIPIDGSGLNPQLRTFWMTIHPPIVFGAYALFLLAYALTLASMKAGIQIDKSKLFRATTYGAWLLLTLGIALGGVWAYQVQGWGGYWAWDPVETASLLPWLMLTAYFYLPPLIGKTNSLTKETMILAAFASLLFLSALTRGGFAQSVHAYGVSPVGPILMSFAVILTGYFFYLKRKVQKPFFRLSINRTSVASLSAFAAFISLILMSIVCLWGLIFPIVTKALTGNQVNLGPPFFNVWNLPFAVIFIGALIGFSLGQTSVKRYLAVIAVGAALGISLMIANLPTSNLLVNFGFSFLALALIGIISRFVFNFRDKRARFDLLSRGILHLAIVVLLIGVVFSSANKQVVALSSVEQNGTVQMPELAIQTGEMTFLEATGRVQLKEGVCPECSSMKLDVTIQQNGQSYRGELWVRLYATYGLMSTPLIINTPTSDIYVYLRPETAVYDSLVSTMFNQQPTLEQVTIEVETIPYIYLVWIGIFLLACGMVAQLIKEIISRS